MPRIAINAVQDADPDILTILAGISSPRSTGIRCGVEDRTRQVASCFSHFMIGFSWSPGTGKWGQNQPAKPRGQISRLNRARE